MTRVAVVGAGIIGCMIARELAGRGRDVSVTVLDRDTIGSGASLRSAGLHVPRGATAWLRRMAEYSHAYYRGLMEPPATLPIRPLRLAVLSAEPNRVEETYGTSAALARGDSVPLDFLRIPEGCAIWWASGCHHADVPALAQAIAAELRGRVRFREGVRVLAVEAGRGGIVLRLGTGERLTVDRVVLAPGPWLDDPAIVAPLAARVKKIVAMHVERRPAGGDPAVMFQDDDAFLLPLPARGHWLFSYTCPEWDVDPDGLGGGLTAENVSQAHAILRRYAPGLVDYCDSGRVFCDAYSVSGEPVVQALKEDERVVFAGAASGLGYRLAPAIADLAVELLGL